MSKNKHPTRFSHLAKRDLHVHTAYCKHAQGSMEDYVLAAIDLGLDEIGFLAHAEAAIDHPRVMWMVNEDYDLYWQEGRDLGVRYRDRITVSLGLELGLNTRALEEMRSIVAMHPWDRIGLSYHQVTDGNGHLNICSRYSAARIREVDSFQMVKRYYRDLCAHVRHIKPHMLCHLDVVRKYLAPRGEDPLVHELILDLLGEMKRHNVCLEVNTAGYDSVGAPYPEPWIIREAVAMGIDLVLNSDSHEPEHVGRHFDRALQYIEEALAEDPDESYRRDELCRREGEAGAFSRPLHEVMKISHKRHVRVT